MKKFKITGIAVAALLAVSPVVSTTVGQTQVADAATTGSSSSSLGDTISGAFKAFQDAVNKFLDQAKNQTGTPDTNQTTAAQKTAIAITGLKDVVYNNDNPVNRDMFTMLETMNNEKSFKTEDLADALQEAKVITDDATNKAVLSAPNLDVSVVGAKDNGDFAKIIDNMVQYGNGQHFSINISATDPDNKNALVFNRSITFTNNTKSVVKSADLKVNYTTPVSVSVNSQTLTEKMSTSVDAKVTNSSGANVDYSSAYPGGFYKSENDAITGNGEVDLGATFNVDGTTYYQPVRLDFDKSSADIGTIFANMQNASGSGIQLNGHPAYQINVNKKDQNGDATNSITYVRAIQVGAGFVTPDNPNNNNNNTTNPDTDNGTWTTTSQPGIVTVNGSNAPLANDDNAITSRMLGAGSAWQTDSYRTNSKTGVKQYHVSTHEWVDASNVTFGSKTTTSGLGNVTDLSGHHTVDLSGPAGFIYTLFTTDGGRSNRGLAGLSSWYTDKSATDASGNTYYRVSTDEWVQASTGVTVN